MKKLILATAISAMLATPALSGEYGGGSPKAYAGAHSASFAKAQAASIAAATGGAGGLAAASAPTSIGGSSTATSYDSDSRAYALGLSLTTSQGHCPLLGSVNIAVVAFTYEIALCKIAILQQMVLTLPQSQVSNAEKDITIVNLACSLPELKDNMSKCAGR